MKKTLKRFLWRSTWLALAFVITGFVLYTQVIPQHYHPIFPFLVIFFFLVTNLVHAYLLNVAWNNISKFMTRYMLVSFLKFLLFLVVAIVFLYFNKEHAKSFLINFLIVYFGFTFIEVAEISQIVRKK